VGVLHVKDERLLTIPQFPSDVSSLEPHKHFQVPRPLHCATLPLLPSTVLLKCIKVSVNAFSSEGNT